MKIKRPKVLDRESFAYGARLAAEVASDYDRYSSHPYLVSECILAKLNLIASSPRKNRDARSVEAVLAAIDRRLEEIKAEVLFATRHTNYKRSTRWYRESR